MQKIQYNEYGGPEELHLDEVEPPSPGQGQVLVRVRAAAANPMDWRIRNGDVKLMTGRHFPRGLGHDFAGTVVDVGEGVTRFQVGDAVLGAMSMRASGAYAEMVVADENTIVAKPARLSFEEAAALPTVGVAALQSVIDKGKLQAGQTLFVNGCLGGVGRAAVQIAQMHGARVGGSCRASAATDAKALGIDPVVDFDFNPMDLEGRFDLVIDTAGTMSFKNARTLLKPHGRIVELNGSPAKLARSMFSRSFKLLNVKYTPEALSEVSDAAVHGKLDVPIAETVPLNRVIEALTKLERTHSPRGGKLVMVLQ
jgi:NADPH:quinone reductase-like Zn-dependent oxidoreductase